MSDTICEVREIIDEVRSVEAVKASEVREIIDSSLAQFKEWLDWRLKEQEGMLRGSPYSQDFRRGLSVDTQETMFTDSPTRRKTGPNRRSLNRSPTTSSASQLHSPRRSQTGFRSWRGPETLTNNMEQLTEDFDDIKAGSPPETEEQEWVSNLMSVFDQLDLNRSGSIDLSEMNEVFKEVGMSDLEALSVFQTFDKSGNGSIDRVEWLHAISESARGDEDEKGLIQQFLDQLASRQSNGGTIFETNRTRFPRCILRHDSVIRMAWDIFLMILLAYVSLSVPFTLGFGESRMLGLIDRISDMFFCCDVMLNFRTTYIDRDETLVVDGRKIARKYFRSWFALDVLSSAPFDLITAGLLPDLTPARLLKIGKIAKVLKLLRISRMMAMYADSPILEYFDKTVATRQCQTCFRMVKLLSIAFIVAHWLACFGCAIDCTSLDVYFDPRGGMSSSTQKYLAGIYWAMTTLSTVGYGDITPQTDAERAYAMAAMVIGGSLYGYVVGSVTSIVTDRDVNAHAYHERMELIQSWLDRHSEIEATVRRRIRKHFKRALSAKSVMDDSTVVNELSPELRADTALFLVHARVRYHPMFGNVARENAGKALAELVSVLQKSHIIINEFIVRAGDPGIGMYILVQGCARYDQGHKWQPPGIQASVKRFQHMIEGDSFGEEILFNLATTYSYTIKTISDCEFHWISSKGFRKHFENMPELFESMRDSVLSGWSHSGSFDTPSSELPAMTATTSMLSSELPEIRASTCSETPEMKCTL